jgi:hypothetical protein
LVVNLVAYSGIRRLRKRIEIDHQMDLGRPAIPILCIDLHKYLFAESNRRQLRNQEFCLII